MAVPGERAVAMRAALHVAAVAAEDPGVGAAPVQEEQCLLLAGQHLAQRSQQLAAEDAGVARAQFAAHVNQLHLRQRDHQRQPGGRRHIARFQAPLVGQLPDAAAVAHDALRKLQQTQVAALRVIVGLDVRRGAAQQQDALVGAHHLAGNAARVIVGNGGVRALPVAGVMLLIEDDEADVGQGRVERRARAHHHLDFTRPRAAPEMMSFAVAEATVRHGDLAREAGGDAAQRLCGQRDFRDEEERLPTLLQRELDGAQINFGLAAAGYAVQQEAAPGGFADLWPAAQFCLDLLPDGLLPGSEWRRGVGHKVARDAGVVPALALAQVN